MNHNGNPLRPISIFIYITTMSPQGLEEHFGKGSPPCYEINKISQKFRISYKSVFIDGKYMISDINICHILKI